MRHSDKNTHHGQHWLFAHDTWFTRRADDVYVMDALPAQVWQRYLDHTDSLTVLARTLPPEQADWASTLSSRPGVDFILCDNISSPRARVAGHRRARVAVQQAVANADAVIARLPSEYGLLAAAEAERTGKPYLIEVAGCPWDGLWNYGGWQGKAYAPIMAARTRRAVARAPFVTYVTREFLQRRYPNRVGRQIACSDVQIDTPDEAVLEKRMTRIAQKNQPVRLGLIGTLKTRYKGIQTVFAALARLRDELPQVEFHVLGAGDSEPWVEEARSCGVADLVYFDALCSPGAEVMAWLDDIDVYLQPSFKEGLPRATIEAMSRGCPVIGSTCAGIPELLADECCIKPGDDAHLARLLIHTVTDGEWQQREAEANWREAHEYSRTILDARRDEMLGALAEAVDGAKQRSTS